MHLHFYKAVTLAGFTASSLDIKAEAPRLVTARARFGCARKQFADRCKQARVGGRVAARCASDGALIDCDNLVDSIEAGNRTHVAGTFVCAVDDCARFGQQGVVDERRFSGA